MTNYTNPYPYLEGLMLSVTKDIVNVEIEKNTVNNIALENLNLMSK